MSCHSAWFLSPFIFYSKCGFNELEKSLFIQWNVMGNECKQTHKCTHRQAHTHAHMQTYAIKHQTAVSVQHTYAIGEWTYTRRYFAKLLIIHENLIKRKKNEAQHSRMMYQIADTCMSCRAMHTFVLRITISNVDISWNRLETISSFVWYFTVLDIECRSTW